MEFYQAICSLYTAPQACVKINDTLTNWFFTPSDLKQGDALSPTLFAFYRNNLAIKIKYLDCGNEQVCILLYVQIILFCYYKQS